MVVGLIAESVYTGVLTLSTHVFTVERLCCEVINLTSSLEMLDHLKQLYGHEVHIYGTVASIYGGWINCGVCTGVLIIVFSCIQK